MRNWLRHHRYTVGLFVAALLATSVFGLVLSPFGIIVTIVALVVGGTLDRER